MVVYVRTPFCMLETLRNEEPFYVGAISIPEKPEKPKRRKEKPQPSLLPVLPPPKPAESIDFGEDLDDDISW